MNAVAQKRENGKLETLDPPGGAPALSERAMGPPIPQIGLLGSFILLDTSWNFQNNIFNLAFCGVLKLPKSQKIQEEVFFFLSELNTKIIIFWENPVNHKKQ